MEIQCLNPLERMENKYTKQLTEDVLDKILSEFDFGTITSGPVNIIEIGSWKVFCDDKFLEEYDKK